jgi:hypothetical protein
MLSPKWHERLWEGPSFDHRNGKPLTYDCFDGR